MRAIKKTIKTTVVEVYKPDMATMTFENIGEFGVVGGLGERLCVSRAKREYGKDVIVKCHDVEHVYKMDADTFLKYAVLADDDNDTDTDAEL